MIILQCVCSFLVKCPWQSNLHYQRFALWDWNPYKVYFFTWIGGFNDSSDRKYTYGVLYWNSSGIPSWSKVKFFFFYFGDRVNQLFLKSDSLPQLVALVVSSPCRDEIDPNKKSGEKKTWNVTPWQNWWTSSFQTLILLSFGPKLHNQLKNPKGNFVSYHLGVFMFQLRIFRFRHESFLCKINITKKQTDKNKPSF